MKTGCRLLSLVLLGTVIMSLLVACASIDHDKKKESAIVAPPPVEQPKFIFHRVMDGETLGSIARWYSGNEALWYELKEHNPSLDPNRLKKGDVVKVPVGMAIVHNEQPNFSTQQRPQKAVRGSTGKASTAQPEEPDVFGPK